MASLPWRRSFRASAREPFPMEGSMKSCRSHLSRFLCIGAFATMAFGNGIVHAALPPGNAVQQWNKIAEDTVIGSGAFQNEGLIYMAYVSAAVYDAVVGIEGRYTHYATAVDAPPGASVDAAAIEAAYRILRHYFPTQAATLDGLHVEALAGIPDGIAKNDGKAVGA